MLFKYLPALGLLALAVPAVSPAHVHWHRGNDVDVDCLALYRFSESAIGTGDALMPVAPLSTDLRLIATAPAGDAAAILTSDLAYSFFAPGALRINSDQTFESPAGDGVIANTDGDLTIEFWFRWDPSITAQFLEIGLRSTVKIVIERDTVTPANDKFRLAFTHGDFVDAPGFTNWVDVGVEEASLGEWRHYAVTIHSTGITFDPVAGHDKYNAGTSAILWLNGHAVGTAPHKIDLEGMQVHDASRVRIRAIGGPVEIDEFTIWARDWSNDGASMNPFANGRGDGLPTSVAEWELYR